MESADFFEMFGLPRRYELDRETLEAAYRRLSLEHHPDFFSTAGAAARQRAERNSARINEGYRVLTTDVLRAEYLLQRLAGDHKLSREELPPGFLQEMFMLQEELDELDASADAPQRARLKAQLEQRLAAAHAALADGFQRTAQDPSLEQLQRIQSQLNCQRYLERLWARVS